MGVWGKCEWTMGLGDTEQRNKAEKIAGLPKIKSIAGGYDHSLFLDCEGFVWACGCNVNGELGLGDIVQRNKAEKIAGLPKIKLMAGGSYISIFVDETGNVWVCGSNQDGVLGLGHSNQTIGLQKNNLSGIVAVAGGNAYFTMFLDKEGNLFTCGNNANGQLGLGHENDIYTPQKVNNIPPISSLSACNTAAFYLQIVDCEGRVWSCGNNEDGQLGLGHTNTTLAFQRIESIPKLKGEGQRGLTEAIEKRIFKAMEKEQSNEMMAKIKLAMPSPQLDKEQAKQKIISGVISMADWPSKWRSIHEKKQQMHQCIQQYRLTINNKQQQLLKLTQERNEIEKALCTIQELTQTLEFYDALLEPIAEAEEELKSGFEEKLKAGKHGDFTVDEVSLFLNVCGMENLVTHQRKNKIDGALLADVIEDVTVLEVEDRWQESKLEFYLKVLGSGKMMKQEELRQSVVWRHREVEKTLMLMKEWEIELDEEMVRKKGISICHLLYFKAKDFKKELGVEWKKAMGMVRKLKKMRKDFEDILGTGQALLFDSD